MSTGAFPGPLGHFVAQLDEARTGDVPDLEQIGRLLVELAADEDFFGPLIAEMPADQAGGNMVMSSAPVPVPTRSSCWVTTCTATNGRNMTPAMELADAGPPAIQAVRTARSSHASDATRHG